MRAKSSNSYISIVFAAIIWGSAGSFIKYLQLPPSTITFFRLVLPVIILIPYLSSKGLSLKPNKKMLTASILNGFRMFLYAVGFTYASIGGAVIMLYTWPLFVSLFAIPMAKEPLDLRSGLLLTVAFIGIILVYGEANISFSDNSFIGLSAILLNSIILALVTLMFRDELATRSQFQVVYFQNLAGAVMFLPFFLLNRPFPTLHQITIGSIYAFLVGIISFSLFFYALKHLRMVRAASLSYIEVISAIFFAYVFFEEPLTWNKLVGAIFILSAASLIKK